MKTSWDDASAHLLEDLKTIGQTPLSAADRCAGLNRTTVHGWFSNRKRPRPLYKPEPELLRRLLEGNPEVDPAPYQEHCTLGPSRVWVRAVCPDCGEPWEPRLKSIKNKERALRQAGEPPLPRRDDGAYLWQDLKCVRRVAVIQARKQRWRLEPDETTADKIDGWAISDAAKKRGLGRQPKSVGHRLAIGEAHVLLGGVVRPIQICPLCELWCEKGRMQRGRQWHDDCWKIWKSFRSRVDNPPRLPPPMTRGRRAGAHGTRDYRWFLLQTLKGIESLRKGLRRRVRSKSNARASLLRKAVKQGQFSPYSGRRLKELARAGVNGAAARFVRRIPGSWDALFVPTHWAWQSGSHPRDHQKKRDTRNAILQKHIPLPATLSEIIASGARDPLIVRLHGFGMELDRIVRLTGAPIERVERVIAVGLDHGRHRLIPQEARISRLVGLGMKSESIALLVRCSLADVESVRRSLPQTA